MAQDKFQPILGQVSTPTYVSQGVRDATAGATASALADLMPLAGKAYDTYQVNKVIPEMDEAIGEYEAAFQAQQEGEEAGVLAGGQREAVESIWDNLEIDEQKKMQLVNPVEKEFQANMAKVKAARDQGRISEQQLLGRINQITRQAVMKNPWLEQELYAKAQGYLKMSGVSDVLDYRMDAEKRAVESAQKEIKSLREEADKRNIPYEFTDDPATLLSRINKDKVRLKQVQIIRDSNDLQELMSKAQIIASLNDGSMLKGHEVEIDQFQRESIAAMEDPSLGAQGYTSLVAGMDLTVQDKVRGWRTRLGSHATTEEGKTFLAAVEKDYLETAKIIKEAGSQQEAVKFLKNRREAIEEKNKLQLNQEFDLPRMDLGIRILAAYGDGIKQQMLKFSGNRMENSINFTMGLLAPEQAGQKRTKTALDSGAGEAIVTSILQAKKSLSPSDDQIMLNSVFDTTLKAAEEGTLDPRESQVRFNGLLKTIAENPQALQDRPMDSTFRQNVSTIVDKAVPKAVNDLGATMTQLFSKPENHGTKIVLDVLPNGTFAIVTDNAKANDLFREKFSNKINNALDAYALSQGISREKAAKSFYRKYFGEMVSGDRDLEAME